MGCFEQHSRPGVWGLELLIAQRSASRCQNGRSPAEV
jgi:hypothetical protein